MNKKTKIKNLIKASLFLDPRKKKLLMTVVNLVGEEEAEKIGDIFREESRVFKEIVSEEIRRDKSGEFFLSLKKVLRDGQREADQIVERGDREQEEDEMAGLLDELLSL